MSVKLLYIFHYICNMNDRLNKIDQKLRSLHPVLFALVMVCAIYVPIVILTLLSSEVEVVMESNSGLYCRISEGVFSIFVVPAVETLIFQYAVIKGLRCIFKLQNWALILISVALYALAHPPFSEIWLPILNGFVLAYSFVVYERNAGISGFWMTCIIAIMKNIPFLFYLFKF